MSSNGKDCTTTFQKIGFNGHSSVVLCKPLTGRMHQIRVHLQYLGKFTNICSTLCGWAQPPNYIKGAFVRRRPLSSANPHHTGCKNSSNNNTTFVLSSVLVSPFENRLTCAFDVPHPTSHTPSATQELFTTHSSVLQNCVPEVPKYKPAKRFYSSSQPRASRVLSPTPDPISDSECAWEHTCGCVARSLKTLRGATFKFDFST